MAIVQTVSFCNFQDEFVNMGRNSQFSYQAKKWLFDYLEEYSESIGEPLELDVIALCCEYQESTYEDVIRDYNVDVSECDTPDEMVERVREYLENNTIIVGYDDETILFAQF